MGEIVVLNPSLAEETVRSHKIPIYGHDALLNVFHSTREGEQCLIFFNIFILTIARRFVHFLQATESERFLKSGKTYSPSPSATAAVSAKVKSGKTYSPSPSVSPKSGKERDLKSGKTYSPSPSSTAAVSAKVKSGKTYSPSPSVSPKSGKERDLKSGKTYSPSPSSTAAVSAKVKSGKTYSPSPSATSVKSGKSRLV